MSEQDALIGLRFELSGGLGKMSGDIVGKAGPLYLVRREGADHLELLELDDLKSARFFEGNRAAVRAPSTVTSLEPKGSRAPAGSGQRLFDKIKKSATAGETADE